MTGRLLEVRPRLSEREPYSKLVDRLGLKGRDDPLHIKADNTGDWFDNRQFDIMIVDESATNEIRSQVIVEIAGELEIETGPYFERIDRNDLQRSATFVAGIIDIPVERYFVDDGVESELTGGRFPRWNHTGSRYR